MIQLIHPIESSHCCYQHQPLSTQFVIIDTLACCDFLITFPQHDFFISHFQSQLASKYNLFSHYLVGILKVIMVVHQYVKSLPDLVQAVEEFSQMVYTVRKNATDTSDKPNQPQTQLENKPIFIIVSGEKDANGKSWCPDCVKGKNNSF